jgi:hypothetical protein
MDGLVVDPERHIVCLMAVHTVHFHLVLTVVQSLLDTSDLRASPHLTPFYGGGHGFIHNPAIDVLFAPIPLPASLHPQLGFSDTNRSQELRKPWFPILRESVPP